MITSMRHRSNKLVIIIVTVVIVVLAGLTIYFFKQYNDVKNNPNVVSEEVTKRLVNQVGKLYALPSDEQPTIAEVKDKEKLKDQAFFANVENGDYLLIYTKSKTAIIYREKDNKIIKTGPIALDEDKKIDEVVATKVSVKVLNGTSVTGRAGEVAGDITATLADQVTVDGNYENAKKKLSGKSIVVDVNKTKSDIAQKIADAIGGQVGDLPAGEDKPSTDILVISGQ